MLLVQHEARIVDLVQAQEERICHLLCKDILRFLFIRIFHMLRDDGWRKLLWIADHDYFFD